MSVVERVGESLARRVNRRRFLGRSAASVFGVVAAWAVAGGGSRSALASHCATTSSECQCHPPGGRFCSGSQCSGADCGSGCTLYRGFYDTGCWCTLTCNGGHYRCCDCQCGDTLCGCAEFVPSTTPPPDGSKGEVTICHKGKKTMTIPRSALKGHLGHGDYEGPCKK